MPGLQVRSTATGTADELTDPVLDDPVLDEPVLNARQTGIEDFPGEYNLNAKKNRL